MVVAADWAGRMGLEWARRVAALDRQLAEAGEAGLAALAPRPGEQVIDLGCGGGATTQAIAEAVAPGGTVTAVDISPDLLDVARARSGMSAVRFVEGDAAEIDLEPGHDALFSRFGCMFFADPPAALGRLRGALKPGARSVLTVWAEMARNPWAGVAADTGRELLGPPDPQPPTTPGPFAWADPAYFTAIMAEGGFADIAFDERPVELVIGEGDDPDPVARAVSLMLRIGPLAARLRGAEHDLRDEAGRLLAPKLRPFVRGDWVRMPGVIRVIRARS